MKSSKFFSTFITAIIYCFTIVLHTKTDLIKQYNLSDIALNKIAEIGKQTGNLVFPNKVSSNADFQ